MIYCYLFTRWLSYVCLSILNKNACKVIYINYITSYYFYGTEFWSTRTYTCVYVCVSVVLRVCMCVFVWVYVCFIFSASLRALNPRKLDCIFTAASVAIFCFFRTRNPRKPAWILVAQRSSTDCPSAVCCPSCCSLSSIARCCCCCWRRSAPGRELDWRPLERLLLLLLLMLAPDLLRRYNCLRTR